MEQIEIAEGIKLTKEHNIASVKLDFNTQDKDCKQLDIILKSIEANCDKFDAIYIDYDTLVKHFKLKNVIYMTTYEMRRKVKAEKNILFINYHSYSETLLKLAEGTDNYLITFECPESEKEAMRAVEELEETIIQ